MFHWTSKATRNESLLGPSWSVSLNPNCHSEADGTPACTLRVRTYSHLDALRIVFFIRYWSDANCILDSGQWLPNCWPQAIIRPKCTCFDTSWEFTFFSQGRLLAYLLTFLWHCVWHIFSHAFWHSFWHSSDIFWHSCLHSFRCVFFPFLLTYLVSLHREIAHQERTEKDERSTKLTQRIIEYAKTAPRKEARRGKGTPNRTATPIEGFAPFACSDFMSKSMFEDMSERMSKDVSEDMPDRMLKICQKSQKIC